MYRCNLFFAKAFKPNNKSNKHYVRPSFVWPILKPLFLYVQIKPKDSEVCFGCVYHEKAINAGLRTSGRSR